ncbi:hypothetical protein BH11BAC3_BH11BAC3_11730 [soil metagenome]
MTKKIHYLSGLTITIFIVLHLFNHCVSIFGAAEHIKIMDTLRYFYRNVFVETIILAAVFVQILSGLKLFIAKRRIIQSNFDRLQVYSGLYLAIFFVIHLGAVLTGRFFLHLNTNYYFGVAGLNTFPFNLFFVPYYGLAIMAFFSHIATVHYKKMKYNIFKLPPVVQSKAIIVFGIFLTILIFYGLTNHFQGVKIPAAYNILIGK